MQFQAYKQNYTTIGKKIAEKEMPAKLCQHEQDKTILALGPGLFDQSIFCYLPRKKAEESNVILHII